MHGKKNYVIYPLIALAVGAVSGFLAREGMQTVYPMLEKSALTPPAIVFPIVWTILYILMGLGLARVVNSGSADTALAVKLWVVQLAVNFSWSLIFFRGEAYLAALIMLILLFVLIAAMIRVFWQIDKPAALMQLPYLIWVGFAGYLNYVIWAFNR